MAMKYYLKGTRLRFAVPFVPIAYEIELDKVTDPTSIDERITRLASIRQDLAEAIDAVRSLEQDSITKRNELENLENVVARLRQDKAVAEQTLELPQESLSRLIAKASSLTRWKGRFEGVVIGLVTGIISSLVVWWLTSP